jgi:hypothetical protein
MKKEFSSFLVGFANFFPHLSQLNMLLFVSVYYGMGVYEKLLSHDSNHKCV